MTCLFRANNCMVGISLAWNSNSLVGSIERVCLLFLFFLILSFIYVIFSYSHLCSIRGWEGGQKIIELKRFLRTDMNFGEKIIIREPYAKRYIISKIIAKNRKEKEEIEKKERKKKKEKRRKKRKGKNIYNINNKKRRKKMKIVQK